MNNNTIKALAVLENVYRGRDTMDSQSANLIWDYIQELQDKLHRRNLQIAELKKDIKHLENTNGYLKTEVSKLNNR
jgi:regulator of replication initiation timing